MNARAYISAYISIILTLLIVFTDILWLIHSIILLPSMFFLFIYILYLITASAFLLYSDGLRVSYKLILVLLTVAVVSLLARAGIPFGIPTTDPDVNYIEQLIRLYLIKGKVTMGVGTGEAFAYSFYPFTEVLYAILGNTTDIDPSYLLSLSYVFLPSILFLSLYIIYAQLASTHTALIASFIVVTMFRCNRQLATNPVHPTFAFLFMILSLFLLLRSKSFETGTVLVLLIVAVAIAVFHNTTAFILLQLIILYFAVRILQRVSFKKRFTYFDKNLLIFSLFISILYIGYNLYVAYCYFAGNVLHTLQEFLKNIMFKEFSPIEVYLGSKVYAYFTEKTLSYWSIIVTSLNIFAGASVGLFISLFFIDLLNRLIKKHVLERSGVLDPIYSLCVVVLGLLAIASYLWFTNRVMLDYFYRFFAYVYLFLVIPVTFLVERLYRRSSKTRWLAIVVLALILAQGPILNHPRRTFGNDMPISIEDPRIGLMQAISTAYYLKNHYNGERIYGTRIIFSVIGAKTMITVHELKDYETLRKGELNLLSLIEAKLQDLQFPEEFSVIYSTGEFWIVN